MSKMVTIKRDGNKRLKPRDACAYFVEHGDLWAKLKAGEEIEIPESSLGELDSVIIIKPQAKRKIKGEEVTSED